MIKLYYFSCCDGAWLISANNLIGTLILTAYYSSFFIAGIFIALYKGLIKTIYDALPKWTLIVVFTTLALVPYQILTQASGLKAVWELAFSCIISGCLTSKTINSMLETPTLPALGKYSYSMYLVHFPIMYAFLYLFSESFGKFSALILSIPLIIFVTVVFHKAIEVPSIKLGYKITKKQR